MQLFKRLIFILGLVTSSGIILTARASQHNHDCGEHCCNDDRVGFKSGKAASGKWIQIGVPKRNWVCLDVEDRGIQDLKCQMCEREVVRYVHTMSHSHYRAFLKVGCICAGHMEGDENAVAAKERESYLRSRTQRRAKWLDLGWKFSAKGNSYLKTRSNSNDNKNHLIVITKSRFGSFSASIDNQFLNAWYQTEDEAKLAAFDYLNPAKITIH
jgi:hypothetical protein